jgi:hypothetical protein
MFLHKNIVEETKKNMINSLFKSGNIFENGFQYDTSGIKRNDQVMLNQDFLINSFLSFIPDIIIPKGSIGIVKSLDIERGNFFSPDKNGNIIPTMYRGHKIHFPILVGEPYLSDNFTVEVEPYKLDKIIS